LIFRQVSHCAAHAWPQTCHPPASASQMLGLQAGLPCLALGCIFNRHMEAFKKVNVWGLFIEAEPFDQCNVERIMV
jgi:hypothetical protein